MQKYAAISMLFAAFVSKCKKHMEMTQKSVQLIMNKPGPSLNRGLNC